MEICNFPECNVIFAKDQPEYRDLPALKLENGEVISCWQLSWLERMRLLLTGKIWLSVLTFNQPLQPLLIMTDKPFENRST